MSEAVAVNPWVALAYLIAGVCFIMALRGLSSPESSRRGIGFVTARKIQMTDMPQLVAAFHSLVGLAAVLVAVAAYANPDAFGILDAATGHIHQVSRIEMSLGIAIGAITFSGSVIAFLKLNGNMSGKPILLPARHVSISAR